MIKKEEKSENQQHLGFIQNWKNNAMLVRRSTMLDFGIQEQTRHQLDRKTLN